MIPARAVFEALGADVKISEDMKNVTITKDEHIIEFEIGSDIAKDNGITIKLDAAPEIKDSRTMLPIRFISERLGAKVDWISAENTVTIDFQTVDKLS